MDIGDVLSRRTKERQDGDQIYKAVDQGAVAFLLLWWSRRPMTDLHVITRTKEGSWWSWHYTWGWVESWGARLVRATGIMDGPSGMPEDNLHFVRLKSGPQGKGALAKKLGITVAVDNDPECLWSYRSEGGVRELYQLDNSSSRETSRDATYVDSWEQLAYKLGLLDRDLYATWDWLCDVGPPEWPHGRARYMSAVTYLQKDLELEAKRQEQEADKELETKRQTAAASSSATPEDVMKRVEWLEAERDKLEERLAQVEKTFAAASAADKPAGAAASAAAAPVAAAAGLIKTRARRCAWYDKKVARARMHQAAKEAGATRPVRVRDIVMCGKCRKNEPGAFCQALKCRPCCYKDGWAGCAAGNH